MMSMFRHLLPMLLMFPIGAGTSEVAVKVVAQDNNRFAFDLYGKIRGGSGNLFLSPYSISTALAMSYAGARGETARQMASTLHFSSDGDGLHSALAGLADQLNGGVKPKPYQLDIANALWGQQGLGYRSEFLKLLETSYRAGLRTVNFHGDPEAARKTINQWVEAQTRDKIRDLLGPGVVDSMTDLILTNAIYFKGSWETPFPRSATRDDDFTAEGRKKPVPTMHMTADFKHFQGDTFQALELPYTDGDLSMVVLLPDETHVLGGLEGSLTAEKLDGWIAKATRKKVVVSLPRFKMEYGFDLSKTLQSMGMKDAFGRKADFSGITKDRDLYISAVIHKAFVDVNEEGTEAAAATATKFGARAIGKTPPPAIFRADHPFLFLIRDVKSGSILFLGRVMNPKA